MVSATVSVVSAAAKTALASITDKAYYIAAYITAIIGADSSASAAATNSFAIAAAGFGFAASLYFIAF